MFYLIRIEAGTYLVAGAITNGHVKVNKINPNTINIVSEKLMDMGVEVNIGSDFVEVDATSFRFKSPRYIIRNHFLVFLQICKLNL